MNAPELRDIIWDFTRKINENTNNILCPICTQYGLTILQAGVLTELSRCESHTIGSLAEGTCVAGTNISAMCKKLENMGLLKRTRDPYDERVVKVTLTEEGNEIVLGIAAILDHKFSQIINNETVETLDEAIKGMEILNELLHRIALAEK